MKLKRLLPSLLVVFLLFGASFNEVKAQACSELFISEYLEGASFDKAIEIYNPTSSIIHLTNYKLKRYDNGSATPSDSVVFAATDSILPYGTFVIANGGASGGVLAVADKTSGKLSYNGNDAVALFNGASLIDVIGVIGQDPGLYWSGSGVQTEGQVLVRKATITMGISTNPASFDPSVQWDNYLQNDFSHLGNNTNTCATVCTERDTISQTICSFSTYTFYGNTYNLPGTYHDTVVGVCDTIHTLILDTTAGTVPEMVIFESSSVVCYGDSVVITSLRDHEGTYPTYNWKRNGVSFGTNTPTQVIHYDSLNNGDYFYCQLVSTDQCTMENPVNSDTIFLAKSSLTKPTPTITGNVINVGTTGAGYQWYKDNVLLTNDTNQTLSVSLYDTACYTAEVIDTFACVVTSWPLCIFPNTCVERDTVNETICSFSTYTFYGNTYNMPGTYHDTVTGGTCDTIHTLVLDTTAGTNPTITISTTANVICYKDSILITSSVQYPGPSPTYNWKKNGVSYGGNTPNLYVHYDSINNGDSFSCELISNDPCTMNNPVYSNTISLPKSSLTKPVMTLTGNVMNVGVVADSYQWYKDNVLMPGEIDSILTVSLYDTACYINEVSDTFGCLVASWPLCIFPNTCLERDTVIDTICSFSTYTFYGNTYNMPGTYHDTVTGGTCDTIHTLILDTTAGKNPTITISASNTIVCINDSILITSVVQYPGTYPTYNWKKNGVAYGTNSSSLYVHYDSITNGDVFTCQLVSTDPCTINNPVNSNSITLTKSATCDTAGAPCSELFISEYIEGSGNNKVLEIYNPTNDSIDLSVYSFEIFTNGGTSPTTLLPLSGYIQSYGVHVVSDVSANAYYVSIADQLFGGMGYNGNDAIVLLKNTDTVDILGKIGENPGTLGWSSLTTDKSLVRKQIINKGITSNPTSFDPTIEWDINAIDDTTNIGEHISDCDSCPSPVVPVLSIWSVPNQPICSNESVVFNSVAINEGTTPTYQWKRNGVNVGTGASTYSTNPGDNAYGDTVVCIMTSSEACASPAVVTDTVFLIVYSAPLVNVYDSICAGDSVLFAGNYFKTPGVYSDTVSYSASCDSITNLHLTYKSSCVACTDTNVVLVDSICTGDSILFAGTYYKNAGVYADTVALASGCDSITTLNLSISSTVSPTVSISTSVGMPVCSATSISFSTSVTNGGATPAYQWKRNGNNVGTGLSTYSPPSTSNSNGDTIVCILTSSLGCASPTVVSDTVILQLFNEVNISITDSICTGDSILFAGTYYKNAGIYADTVALASGCDSITTLNLSISSTVSPTVSISTSVAMPVCSATSISFSTSITNGGATPAYQWKRNGNNVGTGLSTYSPPSTSNSNGDTIVCILTSSLGCASPTVVSDTVILQLTSEVNVSIADSICAGDSILFAGTYYKNAGIYADTVALASGCDSITNLTLSIASGFIVNLTDSICAGDSILFAGNYYYASGSYSDTTTMASGCDSITNLVIINKSNCSPCTNKFTTLTDSICVGDSILFGSVYYNTPGTYKDTIGITGGCDSIVTLNLSNATSVTPSISISANLTTICPNQSVAFSSSIVNGGTNPFYQWKINGSNIAANGANFTSTAGQLVNGDVVTCYLVSSSSCANPDTVYSNSITIAVGGSNLTTITDTICQNEYYMFNGDSLNTSGTYYDTISNTGGCDSIIQLNLQVFPSPIVVANSDVDTISVGGTVNFYPNGSNASNYLWDFGDSYSSTLNTVSHTYNTYGTFTVILKGELLYGCTTYDTLTIVVLNNVGISENDLFGSSIKVYPNPAKDEFSLSFNLGVKTDVVIELYAANGKLLQQQKMKVANEVILFNDINYEKGVYFLHVKTNNNSAIKKIFIMD